MGTLWPLGNRQQGSSVQISVRGPGDHLNLKRQTSPNPCSQLGYPLCELLRKHGWRSLGRLSTMIGWGAHTHPEHLPQVGVSEPEGDVGDM